MGCPKCGSERVEESTKTWVCYACMHIWMDKPTGKLIGPVCDCGNGAQYFVLMNAAWSLQCNSCLLKVSANLGETAFRLIPNTIGYFRQELLTDTD